MKVAIKYFSDISEAILRSFESLRTTAKCRLLSAGSAFSIEIYGEDRTRKSKEVFITKVDVDGGRICLEDVD